MTPFGIRKKLKSLLGGGNAEPKPEAPKYDVTFEPPNGEPYTVKARQGDTLVLASGRGPQPIPTGCADGTCGTCQVEVLAGHDRLSPATDHEIRTKKENRVPAEYRLGCQTEVLGEGVRVRIVNTLDPE